MNYIIGILLMALVVWALKLEISHATNISECDCCGAPHHPRNLRNGKCFACNKKLATHATGIAR